MSDYVPAVHPCSRKDLESDATLILSRFYPERLRQPGPFPVIHFFDHVLPNEFDLDTGVGRLSDGVEGMTWPDGRVLVSEETYRGAAEGRGRARFTIAHECFHGMRHSKQIRRVLVDAGELVLYRRKSIEPFRDPEWQANYFAGALLMPTAMVRVLARSRGVEPLTMRMARVFQVSTQAAEVRIQKMVT